jgi:hypothetical protein
MLDKMAQGSYGIPFNFTLFEEDGKTPWNLTDATVSMIIKNNSIRVEWACAIDDATAGTCHYTPTESDVTPLVPSTYQVYVTVVGSTYSQENIEYGRLIVTPAA